MGGAQRGAAPEWPPLRVYFGITVILSLDGWTAGRVWRGKLLALREEDFAMAARVVGASETPVIGRHLLPAFMSHIIVSITLAIPGMTLAGTRSASWASPCALR